MGGKSRSTTQQQQQTTTTNVQDIDTTTVGLEDVQESNVALGDQTITQISTDQGAVEAGRDIGLASLDFAGEFGGVAVEAVTSATDRSLDFGQAVSEDAFSFGSEALKAVSTQSTATTKELGAAISKAAEATRSDSAVVTQNIAKTGALVVGAVVLGVVVIMIFRRK